MKRDISFFVPADIAQVYNAYLMAATHEPFERDCAQEPYHTISFGINYSWKYNMNGGSCNIHFMPHGNGTAVIMRFTIVQVFGARYESYAENLNEAMQKFLPVAITEANYNMEEFLRPQNKVTPISTMDPPQQKATATAYCTNCGNPIAKENKFCTKCGAQVAQKACPNCNAPVQNDAAFCGSCGTKL